MAINAKAAANYFLDKGQEKCAPIDHMKLQKLVYFAHGWYMGFCDEPLIEEDIQAWEFGPVIPTIYHEFKHFGPNAISGRAVEYDAGIGAYAPSIQGIENETIVKHFLDEAWRLYGGYSSYRLSTMTHEPGTPWQVTVAPYLGTGQTVPKGLVIPNPVIRNYFKRLLGYSSSSSSSRSSVSSGSSSASSSSST